MWLNRDASLTLSMTLLNIWFAEGLME